MANLSFLPFLTKNTVKFVLSYLIVRIPKSKKTILRMNAIEAYSNLKFIRIYLYFGFSYLEFVGSNHGVVISRMEKYKLMEVVNIIKKIAITLATFNFFFELS